MSQRISYFHITLRVVAAVLHALLGLGNAEDALVGREPPAEQEVVEAPVANLPAPELGEDHAVLVEGDPPGEASESDEGGAGSTQVRIPLISRMPSPILPGVRGNPIAIFENKRRRASRIICNSLILPRGENYLSRALIAKPHASALQVLKMRLPGLNIGVFL